MTDAATATEDRVVRIERLVAATPERVFQYWTEPELFTQWMGPEGFSIPSFDHDFRVGGQWRQTMQSPDGKLMTVRGVFRAIEPPRRLVYTWSWDADMGSADYETEVTVVFEPAPGGTRIKLTHQIFANVNDRDGHNRGWASTLNRLERVLTPR